jgi:predicted secreted acid phosphatase
MGIVIAYRIHHLQYHPIPYKGDDNANMHFCNRKEAEIKSEISVAVEVKKAHLSVHDNQNVPRLKARTFEPTGWLTRRERLRGG